MSASLLTGNRLCSIERSHPVHVKPIDLYFHYSLRFPSSLHQPPPPPPRPPWTTVRRQCVVYDVDQLLIRVTYTPTHLTVSPPGLINLARNACEQSYHRHPDVPQPLLSAHPPTHYTHHTHTHPHSHRHRRAGYTPVFIPSTILPSRSGGGDVARGTLLIISPLPP